MKQQMVSFQRPFVVIQYDGVIPARDAGIQPLLYNCLMCSFAVEFSGSQCLGTGMTEEGGRWDDTLTIVISLLVSGI